MGELVDPFHPVCFGPSTRFLCPISGAAAVFLLRGADEGAEPYVSKTANLRRRLQRLLAPPSRSPSG